MTCRARDLSTNSRLRRTHSDRFMNGCPHLVCYKQAHNPLVLFRLCILLRAPNAKPVVCFSCGAYGHVARLHACMHCVWLGCRSKVHQCLVQHFGYTRKEHVLALDIVHRQLWCHRCEDYVYDRETDSILASCLQGVPPTDWRDGDISEDDSFKVLPIPPTSFLGLRGLTNLGNTCFMNCIIQALLHNPLLRAFFLSDMHNRKLCRAKAKLASEDSANVRDFCLACEMDELFDEFFSGQRDPFRPHTFLFSIWKHANSMAGYEQQDAHELLICALNGLHSHFQGDQHDCQCIMHQIFSGLMRSDVTCLHCNNRSTVLEPFFDISLDVPKFSPPFPSGDTPLSPTVAAWKEIKQPFSLEGCLERFTTVERLQKEELFRCGPCNSYQECMKQLSFHMLPNVAIFHLKRFSQKQYSKHSSKIDTFIGIPLVLDMAPYVSSAVFLRRSASPCTRPGQVAESENKNDDGDISNAPPPASYLYDLFAVVCHHGRIDNGHYTCYVRHDPITSWHGLSGLEQAQWVKCDDASLTYVPVSHVLRSQGYLLFYLKRCVQYGTKRTASSPPRGSTPKAVRSKR